MAQTTVHTLKTAPRLPGGARVPIAVLVFLLVDIVFLGLNAGWRLVELFDLAGDRPSFIEIRSDYGLPEITNFVKYLTVSALLVWGVQRSERWVWRGMAIAFVALFLEDALRIHENVSAWIGKAFLEDVFGPGKDAVTFGQFPYYIVLAIVVFGGALLTLRRATRHATPRATMLAWRFVCLLILLASLGAGVDFVNSYILESYGIDWIGSIGSLVENGGELIVMSLCVWVAILVTTDETNTGAATRTGRQAGTSSEASHLSA